MLIDSIKVLSNNLVACAEHLNKVNLIQPNLVSRHVKISNCICDQKSNETHPDVLPEPLHMSRVMRKPDFCLCENKGADQLRFILIVIHVSGQMSRRIRKPKICLCENKDADQLMSAFVFATGIVQSLYFLNPKFQASSLLL